MPLVSVLLPFQKEGEWLNEAIQSILHQTYQEWELLLIENGADERTLQIAERYALTHSKIKIVQERKAGVGAALNKGLEIAAGDYIARMDADDVSFRQRLQRQVEVLEKNTMTDVVSTMTDFHPDGAKGEGFRHYMNWQNNIITVQEHATNRFIESPLAHPSVMYRKSLIEEHGHYSTDPLPEDYELWLRWYSKAVQFVKIPEVLLYWRDHNNRLSRTSPDYTPDKFLEVKAAYLSEYLIHQHPNRKFIVCGAGTEARRKSEALLQRSVQIYGYSDVKVRKVLHGCFIPVDEIGTGENYFYISFVSGRGKGEEVRLFLKGKGLTEGTDFIIAA